MYNPILDRLPEDYKGWLIRTDYRIGIQIILCMSDPELPEYEKTAVALELLYGRGIPDFQTAVEGLGWFISCGNPRKNEPEDGPEVYSFEHDAGRIVSAFKRVFHRDITREKLHWFEFVPMLADLDGTAFSGVMTIRGTKVSDVDQKRRAEFARLKERFAIPTKYTEAEKEKIDEVLAIVRG